MDTIELRVLLTPSQCGRWYAQVLDHDLAADGRDIDDVLFELSRVLNVHVASCNQLDRKPFECLGPAPSRFHKLWETAKDIEATLPDLRSIQMDLPPIKAQMAVA